jgi:type II secretory ATPase GspE/PulE/Tfp pilus assembly ATPase PilB-like protein
VAQQSEQHTRATEELAERLDAETALDSSVLAVADDGVKETDSTLVQLLNKIILDAHRAAASDIHIDVQPGEENVRVRFRTDGVLQDHVQVPARFRKALISRIKIMANLDISERRKPQDGKINFRRFGPAAIELRVATIPTHGDRENAVLRILSSAKPLPLEKMNFAGGVLERIRALAQKPYGLLLVCGPTGSGKTTTLHSILGHINTPDRKIWTVEDPVEITQPGLSQVQVNVKQGLTFAAALRAFLRADPDVIMVGEMRDEETAQMGVEASLTGHLVLSTLHTNSAAEAVTRLLDMGLDPFNFADALIGVLAQRLVRRLCSTCRRAEILPPESLEALAREYCLHANFNQDSVVAALIARWHNQYNNAGEVRLMRPIGCEACNQSGYRGRLGLHELLVGTPEIRRLVRTRAPISDLLACATAEGMHTLKQDGIEKMLQGQTTMEQVRAACA